MYFFFRAAKIPCAKDSHSTPFGSRSLGVGSILIVLILESLFSVYSWQRGDQAFPSLSICSFLFSDRALICTLDTTALVEEYA